MGRCHSSGTRQASVTCHSCRTRLSRRSKRRDAAATPCRTSRNTGDTGVQHSDRAQHVIELWRHRLSTFRPCPARHGTLETQAFNTQTMPSTSRTMETHGVNTRTVPSTSRNIGDTGVQHAEDTQGVNTQTVPSTSRNTGDTGGQYSDHAQHVTEHWRQGFDIQTVLSTSRNTGDTGFNQGPRYMPMGSIFPFPHLLNPSPPPPPHLPVPNKPRGFC